MNTDKEYGASFIVHDMHEVPWGEIKKRLVYESAEILLMPMVDSGDYHVLKFDMAKVRRPDIRATEYVLIVKASIAQQRHIQIAKIEDISFRGMTYQRVCNYCGNALMLSARGACNACGSPNGGYK